MKIRRMNENEMKAAGTNPREIEKIYIDSKAAPAIRERMIFSASSMAIRF